MQTQEGYRPYPQVALELLANGWAPLPLPKGRKKTPPDGWTGSDGAWPSGADVAEWVGDPKHSEGNTAVRLPKEATALDVDARHGGAETLEYLAKHCGPRPPTWIVSAREATDPSGHRLYRLPAGFEEADMRTGIGGIDVLRWGHRYSIAPGSTNPDAGGAVYRCWHEETGQVLEGLPPVSELPELPESWARAFLKPEPQPEEGPSWTPGQEASEEAQAWAIELLRRQARTVADTPEGGRNEALNTAALIVGHYIPHLLDHALAVATLTRAAELCGLEKGEARATIASGLAAGMAEPLDADLLRDTSEALGFVSPALLDNLGMIDWAELWADEDEDREELIPGVWTAGALGTIYSGPGIGKSLIGLEWSACLAEGLPILGEPVQARTVLYIDHENDRRLLRERLESLGFQGVILERLHYSLLGEWPALDTAEGGKRLVAVVQLLEAELVVLDTTARVIAGEENVADTFHALYRHTLRPLKALGVAVMRLDHTGKDTGKGERGSSAKRGDVDLAYHLYQTEVGVALKREKNRLHLDSPDLLSMRRESNPLRHVPELADAAREARIVHLIAVLDSLGVPTDAGRDRCRAALSTAGETAKTALLEAVVRRRKLTEWNDA
jgi:hypothetical protein